MVAVDNGINPNILRRWVLEHERLGLHALDESDVQRQPQAAVAPSSWLPFGPVTSASDVLMESAHASTVISADSAQETIRVEVAGTSLRLSVHWPTAQSEQLARWVRALLATVNGLRHVACI